MTRLTWTTERPTKPGWYWARFRSHDTPAIVEVFRRGNGELWIDRVGPLDNASHRIEWAGPIPEPEEPTP